MNPWKPIKTYRGRDHRKVDLWLNIYASPMSMGFSDSFRVADAYRKDGEWWHWQDGEKRLNSHYITHWMPTPPKPTR